MRIGWDVEDMETEWFQLSDKQYIRMECYETFWGNKKVIEISSGDWAVLRELLNNKQKELKNGKAGN